jgi:hypothetical protein
MKFISYFKRFKQFIGFIVFVGMFIYIFLSLTYLFRQNPFGYNDRISVAGFPEEKSDSIDVVYIGGSAAFVYWEPYRAYSDCGFTSYDLATNTLQAESIIAYLEFSEKYQNPDLYIIGLRSFQYYSEDGDEIGLRLTSDSLDEGLIKFKLINRYMGNRILDADKVALYFSLIKYHTNYVALGNQTAWEMIDNRIPCPYKGCQIQETWAEVQQPINFISEDRAYVAPGAEKTMNELLDYCDSKRLNVLFVVCPYGISKDEYEIYNSLKDTVVSRGYDYLNANDYYDEMGLDFSTDFYERNHVNAIGAEKYTVFLEQYLQDHYDLPDHRGNPGYEEWDDGAELFIDQSENIKQTVLSNMQ